MTEVTNERRAEWAGEAVLTFTNHCKMDGETPATKATDLATNLVHFLMVGCGMSYEEARKTMTTAIDAAAEEVREDTVVATPPVEEEYPVRLWMTARMLCETSVMATSMEDAIAKVKEIDFSHHSFRFETQDGDETAHIEHPESDISVEVDLRSEGEPMSWTAIDLVKDLAKLSGIKNESFIKEQTAALIDRAKAICTKEEPCGTIL